MKKHISEPYSSWLWVTVVVMLISSCGGPAPDQNLEDTGATPATSIFIQEINSTYAVLTTFEELVNYADVIIIGRPRAERGIINSARDSVDPTKPDPNYFRIAQVYEVEVLRYLQGEGPDTIYVSQSEGGVSLPAQDLTESAVQQAHEQARLSGEFLPLALNERYVMVLKNPVYVYDFPETLFLGNIVPWKFHIDEADCVYPESVQGHVGPWPPQTLESFLYDIQNRTAYPEIIPYPYTDHLPVVHGSPCQPSLPPTPYP